MAEPRTIRELRHVIRDLEAALEKVAMSPAIALSWGPEFFVRRARLALRQADIRAAKADDPRLEVLPALRPQLRDRRPSSQPRRRKYRCPLCFAESLRSPDQSSTCYRKGCEAEVEPVRRMPSRRGPATGEDAP